MRFSLNIFRFLNFLLRFVILALVYLLGLYSLFALFCACLGVDNPLMIFADQISDSDFEDSKEDPTAFWVGLAATLVIVGVLVYLFYPGQTPPTTAYADTGTQTDSPPAPALPSPTNVDQQVQVNPYALSNFSSISNDFPQWPRYSESSYSPTGLENSVSPSSSIRPISLLVDQSTQVPPILTLNTAVQTVPTGIDASAQAIPAYVDAGIQATAPIIDILGVALSPVNIPLPVTPPTPLRDGSFFTRYRNLTGRYT